MSIEPATMPGSLLYGDAAWRRTLAVRERYLGAGNPDQLPPPDCGVRHEIILSWRRSLLSGMDTASTDLPCDCEAVPPGRLVQAAQPGPDRVGGGIAGTQGWGLLAGREGRRVRHIAREPALARP